MAVNRVGGKVPLGTMAPPELMISCSAAHPRWSSWTVPVPALLLTSACLFLCSCTEDPTGEPSKTEEAPHVKEPAEPNGFVLTNGTSGDRAAAQRLAARLYHLDGFKRTQVASFLRKK